MRRTMSDTDAEQLADDTVREFLRRVRDEAFRLIEAATVPLYGFQDNQVKQDRTGILFRVANTHFILTAAHGLWQILGAEIPLLADFSMRHKVPIPLVQAKFWMSEEEDGRDIAAIEIPISVVADLSPQRQFLTMADVDTEPQPRPGFYAAFGFPTEWYRKVEDIQRTEPLCFLGAIYEGKLNPDAFFDPKVHLALTFEQDVIDALTGEQRQLPNAKGLSGCGLWRIANYSNADIVDWNAGKVRLVAIQHRWDDRRQYIKGTWITYALRLIWDEYPSLRDAMKLSYPKGY
jgi:hypothetical protein